MIALKLDAATAEHRILKDYLENNAGEALAEKINGGVRIEKDGKTLINRKNLTSFMNYACEEARKQADKGARAACIEDKTVFGWLVHYFEEDCLEGTLYNEDGTEFKAKPAPKPAVTPSATAYTPVPPKPKAPSLFDLLSPPTATATEPTGVEQTENEYDPDNGDSDAEETKFYGELGDVYGDEAGNVRDEDYDETEELTAKARDIAEFPEIEDEAADRQDGQPELRQIGENKYVDNDGIVYECTEVAKDTVSAPPAKIEAAIPVALSALFGGALIMACEEASVPLLRSAR